MKSKHAKPKIRRWKRGKPQNTPSQTMRSKPAPPAPPHAASPQRNDDWPFTDVCPDCLNEGIFKAPIVPGGRCFYFYCSCSIGTAELAGVLGTIRGYRRRI
jgi:hypothetical protein